MDFEEACRELGIDAEAPPDAGELKRIYLRGLRTRNPERQPEAFRRWRDAYEVVGQGDPAPPGMRAALRADARMAQGLPPWEGPVAPEPAESAKSAREAGSAEAAEAAEAAEPARAAQASQTPRPTGPQTLEYTDIRDLIARAAETADADLPLYRGATWVLGLLLDGQLDEAEELTELMRRWLKATDVELRASHNDAVRWRMTSELSDVCRDLAPELRSAIGRAILEDDFDAARPGIRAFREADPDLALHAERTLRADAPMLHEIYKLDLVILDAGIQYTPVSKSGTSWIVAAVILLFAIGSIIRFMGER